MVKFNDLVEFLEEIGKTLPASKIVRVTNLYTASSISPSIKLLSVVATARVEFLQESGGTREEIIRLDRFVGDFWALEKPTESEAATQRILLEKAKAIQQKIEEYCTKIGLEVRAGIYDDS